MGRSVRSVASQAGLGELGRFGSALGDVVQSRIESTTERPPEMKADIARVKSRLIQPR